MADAFAVMRKGQEKTSVGIGKIPRRRSTSKPWPGHVPRLHHATELVGIDEVEELAALRGTVRPEESNWRSR